MKGECEIRWCKSGNSNLKRSSENIGDRWYAVQICEPCFEMFGDELPTPAEVEKRCNRRHGETALLALIDNVIKVSNLSDGELIDACIDEFELEITGRQDALLQELLTRFQKAINLDETPNGITADGSPVWPEEVI